MMLRDAPDASQNPSKEITKVKKKRKKETIKAIHLTNVLLCCYCTTSK